MTTRTQLGKFATDPSYADHIAKAFDRCDSPIEGYLLHCLLKGYLADDIFQQYRVGQFRIDFVTADGIAWELDGKKWHDRERDFSRDTWILANSEIRQIVRIEAAAMMFFRDATLAVMGSFVSHLSQAREIYGMSAARARLEADSWIDDEDDDGDPQEILIASYGIAAMLDTMEFADAYEVEGNVGYVGSPLAFVDHDHKIWDYVEPSRHKLNRWKGRIVNRIR